MAAVSLASSVEGVPHPVKGDMVVVGKRGMRMKPVSSEQAATAQTRHISSV